MTPLHCIPVQVVAGPAPGPYMAHVKDADLREETDGTNVKQRPGGHGFFLRIAPLGCGICGCLWACPPHVQRLRAMREVGEDL